MTPASPTTPSRAQGAGRGIPALLAGLRLLAAAALIAAAGLANAQTRPIPDDAKRGVVRHVQDMLLNIDGNTLRLAAGGHIRDRNNLIIVPSALPAGGALADYIVDMNDQVSRAWLLTDEEARRPKKKPAGN